MQPRVITFISLLYRKTASCHSADLLYWYRRPRSNLPFLTVAHEYTKEKITVTKAQIKFYAQYVRYALPALASVVFKIAVN